MKVIILSSFVAFSSAFPQTGTNLCGVNERGLPRQAGDTWKEDCNRCRCTDNLLPGCTKRFCNIPAGDIIKPAPQPAPGTSVRGNTGGGVQFPGVASDPAGDTSVTRGEPVVLCTDTQGNQRQPGEVWKNDCNDCSCGKNGAPICTLRFCINIEPLNSVSANHLFTATQRDTSNIIQCKQAGVQNCRAVEVNLDYLKSNPGSVNLLEGSDIILQPRGPPSTSPSGSLFYTFQTTDGGDASMTINPKTGGVYGSIRPLTGAVDYNFEAVSPSGSVIYERSKSFFHGMED